MMSKSEEAQALEQSGISFAAKTGRHTEDCGGINEINIDGNRYGRQRERRSLAIRQRGKCEMPLHVRTLVKGGRNSGWWIKTEIWG